MKKIIDTCIMDSGLDPLPEQDSIKLRLRGRGSGYKEGPSKTESEDPLHLCISCKDQICYTVACQLVQELLNKIYEQYRQFCLRHHRKTQQLKPKKLDCSSARHSGYPIDLAAMEACASSAPLSENDIKTCIEARNKARRELNFMEADRIRNYLKSRGIILIDEKGGRGRGVEVTTWRFAN